MNANEYFEHLNRGSWLGTLYRRHYVCRKIAQNLSGRVIDVGCGLGLFLEARPGTLGVDVNPKTVAYCRSKGLDAVLVENFPWPFQSNGFDGAVMDNVLEHMEDPFPVLQEISRLLKPGGVLVAGVPGKIGYRTDPDHKVYYDRQKLADTMNKAGFAPVRFFATPINWDLMEKFVKRHCLYGVFRLDKAK